MTSKYIPPDMKQKMQQQSPQVDLSMAEDIKCEQCGNLTFEEVLMMKKVSALISPTGKAGIVPVPTFSCVACGYVNKLFRPAYMQDEPTTQPTETSPTPSGLVLEK